MQTIQFSMEHLLYDVIPLDNNIMARLTADNILNFRKFIYNYVETHLRK